MSNDTSHDEESPWTTRRFVTAAVVVALIVLMGVGVVVSNMLGRKSDPAPSSAPSVSSPAPSASGSTGGAETSVCGLDAVAMEGSVKTAPAATWSLVGTTAAPTITGQGPGVVDADGYRSCYARTPTGALLAAANYSAIGSYGPLRRTFYERATVPGPGRDALLRQPVKGDGAGGTRIQIAGFRVLRYDGRQADVDLAFRTSNGALGATVMNLQWSGGDWKIRLADDGSELSPVVQIRDLGGYVLWAGA